ncbi:hypothetical protein AY601_2949 [Pedobacter cryoconitis]|uniref:Uncharacterized protein n=1 Tax=Pedobacter cryoconitis TaxID=188932 RepID=A0A127VER9_9SPHI|nr:hypothetical protein [Pedobacter cryoconitis]AMP99823.1 hypothetical protein AY601_2949 [Pedobacter cryoconitis]
MQALNPVHPKKKLVPKGARLKWTPLVKVESVSLQGKIIVGKVVKGNVGVIKIEGNNIKHKFLIP